ncbi:AarF/ABC1/UbiB kinase family protein [Rhodoblastus acidophilus]|uniref:AarF/ABC1/UbiB kinase family protein n=1 Tax=Candidatus Rhodoblastus alkanivorans TaxID=2954117 RepID=A0ABS9Z479_9HYPH|nr:AarF/ABC1/UbiB kinase family protein [Candidatus Rhodoblastus alkanivorans]MCI4680768.1 AarF/ABC1/UbiB kinase family protein [Candidatus Rhodoblastus alkanivorans]MCI4682484.1 AarF/ABC1/UbiB kinase family protein [Candidatus Rhodoblastus alkanivorans]MDI4639790.1 AarF/ABC1/UbiB kinase family protein [Rhodoblastus acidophilus]
MRDDEANRFRARAARYMAVGAQAGGFAARLAGARLLGRGAGRESDAEALARALGGLKGPLMKAAQLIANIPEVLPIEYAEALASLQSEAPPMGAAFVRRRMAAELGPAWRERFAAFDLEPAAAASLGQVHRARTLDGAEVACKLQYPDMASAVEADLAQLDMVLALQRRIEPAIDAGEAAQEIAERLREELDYRREARHVRLYRAMLAGRDDIRVPGVYDALSTGRLLTLDWLDGEKILTLVNAPEAERNNVARAIFGAWWSPFAHYGVIHGDPHLGNYTSFRAEGAAAGINLLDYGCIRIFPPAFVAGVVQLYRGLREGRRDQVAEAFSIWGFRNLTRDLIEVLTLWARFILGPLLDDRVRTIADGVSAGAYGRREAAEVRRGLRDKGPVTIPREFVFMDRAAIGLGGAFLHLSARLNFHRLFEEALEDFSLDALAARQARALGAAELEPPVG